MTYVRKIANCLGASFRRGFRCGRTPEPDWFEDEGVDRSLDSESSELMKVYAATVGAKPYEIEPSPAYSVVSAEEEEEESANEATLYEREGRFTKVVRRPKPDRSILSEL